MLEKESYKYKFTIIEDVDLYKVFLEVLFTIFQEANISYMTDGKTK